MPLSRRRRVATVTLAFFIVEWLLFEFVRAPYSPPHDMRTLLGREKYAVIGFMAAMALVWLLYVLRDACWPLPTARESLSFACLACALAAVMSLIICYPPWPVTPIELLLK